MYVRRIAESTDSFTQGKLYKVKFVQVDGKAGIVNDKGNNSIVAAHLPKYWEQVDNGTAMKEKRQHRKQREFAIKYGMGEERLGQIQQTGRMLRKRFTSCPPVFRYDLAEVEKRLAAMHIPIGVQTHPMCRSSVNSLEEAAEKLKSHKQESNKMLDIKTEETVRINGSLVKLTENGETKELEVSNIIHHMKNEKEKLTKLNELGIESKAIDRIKKGHQDNIDALTKILEDSE